MSYLSSGLQMFKKNSAVAERIAAGLGRTSERLAQSANAARFASEFNVSQRPRIIASGVSYARQAQAAVAQTGSKALSTAAKYPRRTSAAIGLGLGGVAFSGFRQVTKERYKQ